MYVWNVWNVCMYVWVYACMYVCKKILDLPQKKAQSCCLVWIDS